MDFINKLGLLALGSRLKRLSDNFMKDVAKVYKTLGIDFEPRWFPLFSLLLEEKQLSIMDCADKLSVSHPAINQFANQMLKVGLIEEVRLESDKRKRLIKISEEGLKLHNRLKTAWNYLEKGLEKMLNESNHDLLISVSETEKALNEKGYFERVEEEIKNDQLDEVEIIDYDEKYNDDFERLNVEWLEKYFRVEEFDKKVFANPQKEITDKGGKIIFAKYKDKIVGTVALIKISDKEYELAKMSVTEKVRGKQIGKKLMIACLDLAKQLQADKVILVSNTKLTPAINMYNRFGFKPVPLTQKEKSTYERSKKRNNVIVSRIPKWSWS